MLSHDLQSVIYAEYHLAVRHFAEWHEGQSNFVGYHFAQSFIC
jgi:hypothetical protein